MSANDVEKVWLTGFYNFEPERDSSYGFTKPSKLATLLASIEARQIVCVFGWDDRHTQKRDRGQVLGVIEVERREIDSFHKMAEETKAERRRKQLDQEWRHAVPVLRAWRPLDPLAVADLADIPAMADRHTDFWAVGAWLPRAKAPLAHDPDPLPGGSGLGGARARRHPGASDPAAGRQGTR